MKIIVTGVSGFIGGHVARYLAKQGHQVTGLSRRPIPSSNINYIQADLSQPVSSNFPENSYDVLVHCAALTEFNASYKKAYSVNVIGTKQAFQLAQKLNIKKFIYISSFSVYKEFTDRLQVKETFPKVSIKGSSYSQTKLLAENFLKKQNDIPVICLRPHVVYGPGDMTVLNRFLKKIRFNKLILPLVLPKEVSITNIHNLVAGVEFFLEKGGNQRFQAFNISDKQVLDSLTLIQSFLNFASPKTKIIFVSPYLGYLVAYLITKLNQLIYKNPEITLDLVNQLNNNSSMSIEKLSKMGFEPKFTFEQGLKETKNWYKKFNGLKDFQGASKDVWPKID